MGTDMYGWKLDIHARATQIHARTNTHTHTHVQQEVECIQFSFCRNDID